MSHKEVSRIPIYFLKDVDFSFEKIMQRLVNRINIFWVLAYNGIVDNTVKNTMYVEDVGCDFPELRRRRFLIVNNTLNILLYGVAFVVNCSNLFIYFQSAGGTSWEKIIFHKM